MEKSLILASGSPRRKELLTQLGYDFSIVQTDIEERQSSVETPRQYVSAFLGIKHYFLEIKAHLPCLWDAIRSSFSMVMY